MPVVAATIDTTFEYAQELLDLCQVLLAENANESADPNAGGEIDRAYVGFGKGVGAGGALCEEISVAWAGYGEAQTAGASYFSAGRRRIYGRVNIVSFLITVIRDCVPILAKDGVAAPEEERVEASSRELMRDAATLWMGIYRDPDLFGGRCSNLWMIRCDPLEPMGDFAGFELELAAEIDGVASDAGS